MNFKELELDKKYLFKDIFICWLGYGIDNKQCFIIDDDDKNKKCMLVLSDYNIKNLILINS